MALTPAQEIQVRNMIAQEGLEPFLSQVSQVSIDGTRTTGAASLAPAISVNVSDWTALAAFVSQATSNRTLPSIIAAITTAAQARDSTKLGPLFVMLYAAVKAHMSL